MIASFQKLYASFLNRRRDPRYMFVIVGALPIFIICFAQVRNIGLFDSVEKPIFSFFNNLPAVLYDFLFAITQLGGLGGLIIWAGIAWYLINRTAAFMLAGTGILAWTLAKVAKLAAHRERPAELLTDVQLFSGELLGGFGFPSGHATFVAACATVLYYQIAPKFRKYLLMTVFLVGISRMYLGAHFPLDIVGGWALGALIGASACMIFGVCTKGVSAVNLKKYLISKGMNIKELVFADVDARGSRPVFIKTDNDKEYFGKLFGKQEHAADWLFKIVRFFRYKNLQAEEPHISSRRNVEIEGFAMLWAKQNGVRAAKLIDIYQYGSFWLSIQERVNAKPLADHKRLKQESIEDAWRQVRKLHDAKIAHRDLRAANILIDKSGNAWIIDFGFAEVSASPKRLYMDNAELLMSMSLVVGVERTVAAAVKVIDKKQLTKALPYLQTAVFSGATTKLLKNNKQILVELKHALTDRLRIKEEISEANILRINSRKAINLILFAVFIYIIAPQLSIFRDAVGDARITSFAWLIPTMIASLFTYVITGFIYFTLADVPLRIRDASLVQLAASFVSKILPGGLGSTALNAKYLIKSGLDPLETSSVISAQAVIGFVMFTVPLTIFLVLNGTNIFKLINLPISGRHIVFAITGLSLLGATIYLIPRLRALVVDKLSLWIESFRGMATAPRELAIASAASLGVTLAYIMCLFFAMQSVGIELGLPAAVIIYATAVIAKSAVPTPGGLGPVEAAMIASLIAFGVGQAQAVSAVLVYRLATFWIPIPFSLAAYKWINRKRLV